MKYLQWFVLALVLFAVSGCPDDAPPPLSTDRLGARVELAAGPVWQETKDGKDRVMSGTMVVDGARIHAQKGARALVRLNSGAGIFLRGDTQVKLSGDRIVLEKGELWADVPELENALAQIDLGDVTVSASGTGMDIVKNGAEVRVYVARGLAVVESSKGRVEVASGEQAEGVNGVLKRTPVAFFDDWTGGMADRPLQAGMAGSASGRIYGIDRARPGSAPTELQILSQKIQGIIRQGVAYTTVDQTFFNSAGAPVEGWYWFTVPEGASVVRFAWEVNGQMVDGKIVERNQAAASYEAAVEREIDPALLEWMDARTFRARIFPVPAAGSRRIVLGYTELLPLSDGAYRYIYPMVSDEPVQIQEFSLQVDLGDQGESFDVSTLQDATVSKDRRLVSMRRSGFVPRADFLLELRPKEAVSHLRAMRFGTGGDEADYVMLRYTPAVDWKKVNEVPGDVVVVLDTSAGGDMGEYRIRMQAAEAILRALGQTDRFAVISTDLVPRVLFPASGLANATEQNIVAAVEQMSQLNPAGATDLGEMFSAALSLVHEAVQPAIVYVGDGLATSGETSPDALADRLRRAMGNSRARLFAIAVGAGANRSLLGRLADVGGGKLFRIDVPEQVVQESLRFAGQLKTPTITELKMELGAGLDQVFLTRSGKLSEGEEAILLARTHHQLPQTVEIKGTVGGKPFVEKYPLDVQTGSEFSYLPSLWARMYLAQLMGGGLDENRGRIISLGLQYGLMTPFTSFLVLEDPSPVVGPGWHQPFRQWTENARPRATSVALSDVLSIPLFAFGCSESADESVMMEQVEAVKEVMPASAAPPPSPSTVAEGAGAAAPMERRVEDAAEMAPAKTEAPSAANRPIMAAPRRKALSPADMRGNLGTAGLKGDRMVEEARDGASDDLPGSLSVAVSPAPVRAFDLSVCSDAASRSLGERRLIWTQRLGRASGAADMLRIFKEAGERCELLTAHQRTTLLDLIAERVHSAEQVRELLGAFASYPLARDYLRRWIRRAFLDADATMGLYFGGSVNWPAIRTGLSALKTPSARLDEIRRVLQLHPDAEGREILVSVLLENGLRAEAEREAAQLHRQGEATPEVLVTLCDILAANGDEPAARRICSELVEFNAQNDGVRLRLGDIFLRHGWYMDAYRQFASLVDAAPDDFTAQLRLAMAAAGMGKTDEALRIARKVSTLDRELGQVDPAPFATAFQVYLLGQMLADAREQKEGAAVEMLERQLLRTGMFTASKTMIATAFTDLEYAPTIELTADGRPVVPIVDIWASPVGLRLVEVSEDVASSVNVRVTPTFTDSLRRSPIVKMVLVFDGTHFQVRVQKETLSVNTSEIVE